MATEEFDYVLAADVLVPLVKEVRVITELACSPHRPVALRLKGVGRQAQVQVFTEPARIPLVLPPPVRPPPRRGLGGRAKVRRKRHAGSGSLL